MGKTAIVMGMLLLCVAALPTPAQEHAPTIAQCRADEAVWMSDIEGSNYNSPTFFELGGRSHEMQQCAEVDEPYKIKYYNLTGELSATKVMRLESFIDRHGLYNKFIDEDEAGAR